MFRTMYLPSSLLSFYFFLSLLLSLSDLSHAQQAYVNNKQLNCYNNLSVTKGFLCNGPQKSCNSYLTFRSHPPYNSAVTIAYLLGSDASDIAKLNNISDIDTVPIDILLIVPVKCTCSGNFYQHNANYTLNSASETYLLVANDTYQALTTCQAMMDQNPYESHNLSVGMRLLVPLRCACPTKNQTESGVKFLLTYLIKQGDNVSAIGQMFGVDADSINEANELQENSVIYYFTPILIPLKTEPTPIQTASPPTLPQSPEQSIGPDKGSKASKKWIFVGIGIGVGLLFMALSGFLVWFTRVRSRQSMPIPEVKKLGTDSVDYSAISESQQVGYVSSEGVRYIIESLMVYKFEELQRATEFFSEDHHIKGSVYHGVIKGDNAAIKRMKGDVSNEVNMLKQINHSNVIRLSGFCVHEGNTYLVYEFAEKGSLNDCLHEKGYKNSSSPLGWKQRIQIAHDVADGLNYLHNYISPPYIHKDLKSDNILLDGNFRAKIANFGLATRVVEEEEGLQLTRHVVGTHGYMAPEYIESGVVTPKLDVFAFGVIMLELLSGRDAVSASDDEKKGDLLLSAEIKQVLEGEHVREKLRDFMDPVLRHEYPLDLAFSMAQLAMNCVNQDLCSRPSIPEVFISLSKILSSSLDWDPSYELERSRSLELGK
ncbi:PREDICTED: protein LYK5-like [Nelumbo nucifera]|uniref:Protein LYK5-like n=2 Tax=Nelumbo nucifera TaxID=4432 RepID=A0A1U8AS79_NELNU|nr:PREDICTED: protein LYK5-like [Nelumbo nucifera]DAD46426.1 TPA_asm: hypothetical protein HUJ06_016363 [Nelumbo nucifera]